MPWSGVLAMLGVSFLTVNTIFAAFYTLSGGVEGARPGSFWDAFNFSAQTLGTVGYGAMYPRSVLANALVDAESVVSVVVTALSTGLVFSKFARPAARIVFSRFATIGLVEGVPTLSFRLGNERGNNVVEATARVSLVRTVRSPEGSVFYKMVDLRLVRERSSAVARSWSVMHAIDETSPLFGATPESMAKDDAELLVSLAGTDDITYQPVFARHTYEHPHIVWGARHGDVLSETPDGDLLLDVRRFHDVVPTKPTAAFPYPRAT
jgi:inward rectifier potassium channel